MIRWPVRRLICATGIVTVSFVPISVRYSGGAQALSEPPAAPLLTCTDDAALTGALAEFRARSDAVSAREADMARREAALTEARAAAEARITDLEAAEKALSSTMARANRAAEADLGRLTLLYENMKPKRAAGLFEEMEPDFAAGFLIRMRSETAAAIMAGMSPPSAYAVSAVIAGRNAHVPVESNQER